MKFFDWLLNLLGILVMIAILAVVVMGLNGLRMKLNEVGHQHHTLQPR